MKFTLVCVAFAAVFAFSQADTTTINFDSQMKMVADNIEAASKKFEEITGYKTEFDKEKFLNFLKTTSAKLTEDFNKLNEKLLKDSKALPEDLRKKYEELNKQIGEVVKGLNSPDVQAKASKLQETLGTSMKKIGENISELSKSAGLAIPPQIQKGLNEMFDELQKTSKTIQEKSQKIFEGIQEELKKKKN